jgi:crotonobetainyl-CoA:carnitine CoA-transferase CaiB-like acyl-CoA transferase
MLSGIRIVDLSSIVFGPYATELMVDMGADVIKVEPPAGDQMRHTGRSKATRRMGPVHMILNRGKRSMMLDLKTEEDAAVMRDLLRTADVFIHNIRSAPIEKLGFGYEAVKAIKPDIVYVHCVGFGSDGPYAGLQAYDDVIQAATGTASLLPRADGDERPRYFPSLIADKVAGLYGAQAVLGGIIHKLRTGEGQFVEVPMFEAFAHFMLQEHLFGAVFKDPVESSGYPRQIDRNRQPFPTSDGYISIVPYTSDAVHRVFDVLGKPELLHEERFATPKMQTVNMTLLYAEIAKLTPARTTAEWVDLLNAASIPCMPIRDVADMIEDPHFKATDFFHAREHPTEGGYYEMRSPIRFAAAPFREVSPPALLGADNEAILQELGARD